MTAQKPSRVLLLADTHGRLHPEVHRLAEQVDNIVHAGDIGHPRVLAMLRSHGGPLLAVRGNNDIAGKWPADSGEQLTGLADEAAIELPGGLLAVVHGDRFNPVASRHALLRARYPHARLVLYGHSHRQLIDTGTLPWVVNPGAAGRSRTYGGAGCVLLEAAGSDWRLTPFQFALSSWKK